MIYLLRQITFSNKKKNKRNQTEPKIRPRKPLSHKTCAKILPWSTRTNKLMTSRLRISIWWSRSAKEPLVVYLWPHETVLIRSLLLNAFVRIKSSIKVLLIWHERRETFYFKLTINSCAAWSTAFKRSCDSISSCPLSRAVISIG